MVRLQSRSGGYHSVSPTPKGESVAEAFFVEVNMRITNLHDRFWSKVDVKQASDCWNWKAAVRNKKEGYGAFWMNGRHNPAPRVALILAGRYTEGYVVCHKCDNPSCCNPDHLFLGTNLDNEKDKVNKNRQAFGSKNGMAKLSEEDVKHIKSVVEQNKLHGKRLKNGVIEHLASTFNVSQSCIQDVLYRRWRHV
jgi:hypothetical protein